MRCLQCGFHLPWFGQRKDANSHGRHLFTTAVFAVVLRKTRAKRRRVRTKLPVDLRRAKHWPCRFNLVTHSNLALGPAIMDKSPFFQQQRSSTQTDLTTLLNGTKQPSAKLLCVAYLGLLGKWYDACVGWMPTVERMQVFDFSAPYMDAEKTHFYVKAGSSSDFSTSDLTGKRIGQSLFCQSVNCRYIEMIRGLIWASCFRFLGWLGV